MKVLDMCVHANNLCKNIDENLITLREISKKENKTLEEKLEYQNIFQQTIKMMDEYNFYKNQIDEIELFVTVKEY